MRDTTAHIYLLTKHVTLDVKVSTMTHFAYSLSSIENRGKTLHIYTSRQFISTIKCIFDIFLFEEVEEEEKTRPIILSHWCM